MSCHRTRLLVSVRNAAEAAAALAGGADVIDIKEPDRGALGAADPSVWHAVVETVAGRAPVSAALGELLTAEARPADVRQLAAQTSGLSLAKIGLAGARRCARWTHLWQQALAALPPSVGAAAVVYADWRSSDAPTPEEVMERGAEFGCRWVLLDTFDKSRGHLLDHLPLEAVARLLDCAAQRDMQVALAGSLNASLLPRVLPLHPALIAVRGAACRGGRQTPIDAEKVRSLAFALADVSTIDRTSERTTAGA